MVRHSKKSVQETLRLGGLERGGRRQSSKSEFNSEFICFDDKELDRKITLVTEGFTTSKYSEIALRDRTKLSKENTLTVCDYLIDMKREINPRLNAIRTTIQYFSNPNPAAFS